jgi:Mrp family chromosome partitioning ATPase
MPDRAPAKAVVFAAVDSCSGSPICGIAAQLLAEKVSDSVCLVQANSGTPLLPRVSAGNNHQGRGDSLRPEAAVRSFAKQRGPDNLWLLSLDDSLNLLNSDRMQQGMERLRKEFSYVVIDAPPLNVCADGMMMGRLTDGVVLVLEANATRREGALRVAESLRAANVPLLGAVLNNRTFPIPAAIYERL